MTMPYAVSGKPTPAWSDQDLVSECLRGNEQAWAALVEKYKGLVYSAPFRYRLSPQDAADIFQEVWFDLYSELDNLRQFGALRGWLITVAWHKCYQWKQRQRRSERTTGEFDAEPIDGEASFPEWKEQMERQQILRDAVAGLPPRCRTMVDMLFFRDPPLPYSEVARQLGLAEGSIGFIRGRCLQKLRTALQEIGF